MAAAGARLGILVAVVAMALAGPARAQDSYPAKPITIVLPQPAGGAVDLIARTLGERLTEQMRQPVIIENRPGANGGLAAGQVVRSAPDGYTLFMAVDTNLCVNPNLYPNLGYEPFRDFTPISVLVKVDLVLVANAAVPVNSVKELITLAKAQPGKLNYAAIGLGTQQHLGMELFKLMTGTNIYANQLPWYRPGHDRIAERCGAGDVHRPTGGQSPRWQRQTDGARGNRRQATAGSARHPDHG
jgi:tripartite-type tricarboxylate transporter receptor subunit TctC